MSLVVTISQSLVNSHCTAAERRSEEGNERGLREFWSTVQAQIQLDFTPRIYAKRTRRYFFRSSRDLILHRSSKAGTERSNSRMKRVGTISNSSRGLRVPPSLLPLLPLALFERWLVEGMPICVARRREDREEALLAKSMKSTSQNTQHLKICLIGYLLIVAISEESNSSMRAVENVQKRVARRGGE